MTLLLKGCGMEKVISVRADESVHRDLKLLAALKEVSAGELLGALVREEMARILRANRLLEVAPEEREKADKEKVKKEKQARKKKRGF